MPQKTLICLIFPFNIFHEYETKCFECSWSCKFFRKGFRGDERCCLLPTEMRQSTILIEKSWQGKHSTTSKSCESLSFPITWFTTFWGIHMWVSKYYLSCLFLFSLEQKWYLIFGNLVSYSLKKEICIKLCYRHIDT